MYVYFYTLIACSKSESSPVLNAFLLMLMFTMLLLVKNILLTTNTLRTLWESLVCNLSLHGVWHNRFCFAVWIRIHFIQSVAICWYYLSTTQFNSDHWRKSFRYAVIQSWLDEKDVQYAIHALCVPIFRYTNYEYKLEYNAIDMHSVGFGTFFWSIFRSINFPYSCHDKKRIIHLLYNWKGKRGRAEANVWMKN